MRGKTGRQGGQLRFPKRHLPIRTAILSLTRIGGETYMRGAVARPHCIQAIPPPPLPSSFDSWHFLITNWNSGRRIELIFRHCANLGWSEFRQGGLSQSHHAKPPFFAISLGRRYISAAIELVLAFVLPNSTLNHTPKYPTLKHNKHHNVHL